MFTLTPAGAATIEVKGVPYNRLNTFAIFERDADGNATGRMALTAVYDKTYNVFPFTNYDEIINDNTGVVFASLAELIDFVKDYIQTGGSAGGSARALPPLSIVAGAPGNPNEKTAGATIQDNRLIGTGYVLLCMIINSDVYTGTQVSYNNTTGEVSQNPANPTTFQPGDTVIIQYAAV